MKNYILLLASLFIAECCSAQKYVLIDETMMQPLLYTNDVSLQNTAKNIFVVEANHLKEFVSALNKISSRFTDGSKKDDDLNFNIGATKIKSIPISIRKEDRLDIMVNTYTEDINVSMHLSDTKVSNTQNLFFISSWIKYIKSYMINSK